MDNIKDTFIKGFVPQSANGTSPGQSKRTQAGESLENHQIPTTKWENWKYTNLKSLVAKSYVAAPSTTIENIDAYDIPGLESDRLVFVNGKYSAEHSSIELNQGVVDIQNLHNLSGKSLEVFEEHFAQIVGDSDVFSALNTAYAKDGTLVFVPKGKVAKAPIHIIQLTSSDSQAVSIQTRNLFIVGAQAEAKIVESFYSLDEGESLRNNVTEIWVGENAGLEYIKLQQENGKASQLDRTEVKQAQHSRFSIFTLTFNGDIVRNDLTISLEGKETETHLMGAYLLSGQQHVDNFTQILHKKPNSYSNELYKGIIADQATAAFSGKIHVFQEAQKTNAFQSNRNILLSDTANIYTKPQLEIYADDVKCSHGATTGKLEEDAMFYLRARGIKEYDARLMLIHAFAGEVIENISLEPVRDLATELIAKRY